MTRLPTTTGEVSSNFATLQYSTDGFDWMDISADSLSVSSLEGSTPTTTTSIKSSNGRTVKLTETSASEGMSTVVSLFYSRKSNRSYRQLRNIYRTTKQLFFRFCPGGIGGDGAEWFGTSSDGSIYGAASMSNFIYFDEHSSENSGIHKSGFTLTYDEIFIEDYVNIPSGSTGVNEVYDDSGGFLNLVDSGSRFLPQVGNQGLISLGVNDVLFAEVKSGASIASLHDAVADINAAGFDVTGINYKPQGQSWVSWTKESPVNYQLSEHSIVTFKIDNMGDFSGTSQLEHILNHHIYRRTGSGLQLLQAPTSNQGALYNLTTGLSGTFNGTIWVWS